MGLVFEQPLGDDLDLACLTCLALPLGNVIDPSAQPGNLRKNHGGIRRRFVHSLALIVQVLRAGRPSGVHLLAISGRQDGDFDQTFGVNVPVEPAKDGCKRFGDRGFPCLSNIAHQGACPLVVVRHFPVLVERFDLVRVLFEMAYDICGRLVAKRQVIVADASEGSATAGQHPGDVLGFQRDFVGLRELEQLEDEDEIVREDDHLPLGRFLNQAFCNRLSANVIER